MEPKIGDVWHFDGEPDNIFNFESAKGFYWVTSIKSLNSEYPIELAQINTTQYSWLVNINFLHKHFIKHNNIPHILYGVKK